MFNPYTKAILGAALLLVTALISAVEDGSGLTTSEIVVAIVAAIGGLGAIWAAHSAIKWLVGGLTAVLTSFAEAIQDGGISTQEYLLMFSAGLTVLVGIYSTMNTPASNAPKVL